MLHKSRRSALLMQKLRTGPCCLVGAYDILAGVVGVQVSTLAKYRSAFQGFLKSMRTSRAAVCALGACGFVLSAVTVAISPDKVNQSK